MKAQDQTPLLQEAFYLACLWHWSARRANIRAFSQEFKGTLKQRMREGRLHRRALDIRGLWFFTADHPLKLLRDRSSLNAANGPADKARRGLNPNMLHRGSRPAPATCAIRNPTIFDPHPASAPRASKTNLYRSTKYGR